MTRYRAEQLVTAVALSVTGLAVAAAIVLRAVADAIDTACTMPRAEDTCPDLLPDWVDDGSATW